MIDHYQIVIKFDGKGYIIQLVHEPSERVILGYTAKDETHIGDLIVQIKKTLIKELIK